MLKDAFEYLMGQGYKSANQIVKVDSEPSHIYYIREVDGSLTRTEADVAPSKHVAFSLQAIVEKAKESGSAEVWYGPGVVACTYGDSLRESITLEIVNSDPLSKLIEWKKHKPTLTQVELVRELRTTFAGTLGRMGQIVEVLRKVNFRATASTEGEVGHGRASLGKQITGEITGLGVIPEYITFDLPVYANPCFRAIRASVECVLEPDAGTGTFRVIPLPGQLEQAIDSALAAVGSQIADGLGDSDVKVLYGKP